MDDVPELVRRYLDAYNARDIEALGATLSESVTFENVSGGAVTARAEGKAAFMDLARQGAQAFSEREQRVTACIAAGYRAAIAVDYRAVVAMNLPNGWRAGQVISLTGRSFFEMHDGAITVIVDIS